MNILKNHLVTKYGLVLFEGIIIPKNLSPQLKLERIIFLCIAVDMKWQLRGPSLHGSPAE